MSRCAGIHGFEVELGIAENAAGMTGQESVDLPRNERDGTPGLARLEYTRKLLAHWFVQHVAISFSLLSRTCRVTCEGSGLDIRFLCCGTRRRDNTGQKEPLFVDWHVYEHPQLGKVEVGGLMETMHMVRP